MHRAQRSACCGCQRRRRLRVLLLLGLVPACGSSAAAEQQSVPVLAPVEVIAPTPLPDVGLPLEQIPANVQTAPGKEIERRNATDLTDFLNREFGSVHVNEVQGNPFQPDVNFRGYTASPLLGTPQGLSVYLDGVRMNQPFGQAVSWDLIPQTAIESLTLMPGSNAMFGLNTLGGALSLSTKTGLSARTTNVQAIYGSH